MSNYFNESHNPTAKETAVMVGIAQSAQIQKRIDEMNKADKIEAWLKANPEVGYLNSNTFYIMRNGMMIVVPALGDSRSWK